MIYLDNAATSHPKPKAVLQAVQWALEHCGNPGRSGHALAVEAGRAVWDCRQALAEYLGVQDPLNLVFGYNCTDALNLAIGGMVQEGGHVITTVWEHNSVLRPLYDRMQTRRITWTILQPDSRGLISPLDVEAALTPRTCLVVVNHVSNVTGLIQPLAAIAAVCRSHGVPLLGDGAQAAGHIPVNIEALGVDLYAVPGHKGLLGPQGSGALYIGPNVRPHPLRQGGTGSISRQLEQPQDMPDFYESGTLGTPALAGLLAGVNHLARAGDNAFEHIRHCTDYLMDGLRRIPGITMYADTGAPRAGVVSFNIGEMDSTQAAQMLDEGYGIACRPGLHCAPLAHQYLGTEQRGAVRFSPGLFTTQRELDTALRAVAAVASACRKA